VVIELTPTNINGYMRNLNKVTITLRKISLIQFITILGLLVFAFNLQNVLRNYFAIYGTNDDYLMNAMLDGKYSGSNNFHITYINEVASFVLATIYKIVPAVPAYGIFLLLILVISLISPIILQVKQNKNYNLKLIISWSVSSIIITNWFVLNPTFTSASMMISSLGYFILFIQINNKFSKRVFIFVVLLLLLGYLLRVQGFQSSSLIWLPLILSSLGYQSLYKKINYRIFINRFTFLVSIAPIIIVTSVNLNLDSEWKDFYEFNKKRGSIETTTRINYLEANKSKLNIEDELLAKLQNFTLIDQTDLKSEILADLITKSNSSQGISGLINPVVDVQLRAQSLYKYGGLIALMLLLPIVSSLLSARNRIYYLHLGLITSLILFSFYYVLSIAKMEERVVIPLILNLWFFAFAFLDGKQVKGGKISLFVFLIFILINLSIFNKHVHHPTYFKERSKWNQGAIEFSQQQRNVLSRIGNDAIFVGPISAIRLNWTSPYEVSQSKDPNFISFGWHNFSPIWFEKNQRLFGNEDYILDNLAKNKQTYWVSDAETADEFFSSNYLRNGLEFNPKIVSSLETVENIYGGPYNVYSLNSK
jgi:hypothetical protein